MPAAVKVFTALFIVSNVLPVLPVFLDHTHGLAPGDRSRLAHRALLTGGAVAAGLILVGAGLFSILQIQPGDLRIAGGLILLVFAIHDIFFSRARRKRRAAREDVGVVPLGIPILVGPATLTTAMALAETNPSWAVLVAIALNTGINIVILDQARRIMRFEGVIRVVGKVFSLFLAALAVSMLRGGIMEQVLRAGSRP